MCHTPKFRRQSLLPIFFTDLIQMNNLHKLSQRQELHDFI